MAILCTVSNASVDSIAKFFSNLGFCSLRSNLI